MCKSPHARHSVAAKRDRSASNSEVGGFVNHEGIGLSSVSFVIPLSARYTPLAPTTVQPALPDYGRSGGIVPRPLCVLSPPVYCAALLVPLDHFWQFHRFELFTVLTGASLLILLLVRAVLRWKRAEDVARRKGADLVDAQRAAKLGSWCWSPTTDTFTCSGTFFTVTRLEAEAGTIHLRVADDGVGFTNVETRQGLGLVSMRERVRLAGGNFTLRTRPDMGTQIEARVPIRLKPPTELAS